MLCVVGLEKQQKWGACELSAVTDVAGGVGSELALGPHPPIQNRPLRRKCVVRVNWELSPAIALPIMR